MASMLRLNNFRFSIYIDADGTVTLTDLPPELRDVAQALDPSLNWGGMYPVVPTADAVSQSEHASVAGESDEHHPSGLCSGNDGRTQS
jgi:hypothetical protein